MARTFVFGDIHGNLLQLNPLLGAVKAAEEDQMIFLGDYVDRGPASAGVLDRLMQLQTRHRCTFIMGNHEEMMVDARDNHTAFVEWIMNGGDATLRSYGGSRASIRDVTAAHWTFLQTKLVPYLETETHIFVHANVHPDVEMADQAEYMLRWERCDQIAPHQSGKIIVCGHTPQTSGRPMNRGYAICIDTHVYGKNGQSTCLEVTTGRVYQANARGEISRRHISDFEDVEADST